MFPQQWLAALKLASLVWNLNLCFQEKTGLLKHKSSINVPSSVTFKRNGNQKCVA